MANYIIQWSDKTLKSSIALYSGVVDETTTSLTLYGKNAPSWGEKNEENLLHLLEHFASNGTPPRAPTEGQVWYNATDKKLKVFWTGKWNDIGYRRIDSPTVPGDNLYPGTLWFDTLNNILKVRNKAGDWISIVQHHTGIVTPTPITNVLPTPAPAVVVGNPTPLTLPTNPMTPSGNVTVSYDGQIIQDLYITATGGSSGILINGFNNVVIRNCYIVHDSGAGIDLRNCKFITIDHVEIDCTGAPSAGPGTPSAYNIHAQNCPNLIVGNVELYNGSAGVFLENCDDAHIYSINGFNFRGPAPRGEFIAMVGCDSPLVENFYNKQDLSIGWNDSNIFFKNCSNVIVRNGCVDGSNGTEGAGVYLTYDNAIASGGVIENVDAINMGNGAFACSPAQNVTFVHCRVKNNHTTGIAGRPAPFSGGLVFHGFDGNHAVEMGGDPNNIATNLKIEGCTLFNLANPNTIVFDPHKFTQVDYIIADFTPRGLIYLQSMPRIGTTPAPVGTPPTPAPIWSPTPAPNVVIIVSPNGTPVPVAPTPSPGTPAPTSGGGSPAPTWNPPTPTWTPPTPVSPTPVATVPIKPVGSNPSDYPELIFNEDFNADLSSQVFIDHLWYLTSDPNINYSIESGELLIWPTTNFVDRHINTDGLWSFRYGYIEWKAKLPVGKGCWPALWLYAHPTDGRPEIDVMQAYSGGPVPQWSDGNGHPINYSVALQEANADYSVHTTQSSALTSLSQYQNGVDLSADYHVYGLRWTSTETAFYFDGNLVSTWQNQGYFSQPMFVLMSLQFGSISGNPDGSTPMGKDNALRIAYMRAWSLSDGSTLIPNGKWLPASSPTTAPGPTPTPAPTVVPTTPTPTQTNVDPRPILQNSAISSRVGTMTFRDEFEGTSLNTTLWFTQVFDKALVNGAWNVSNSCINIWPVDGFPNQSLGTNDGTPNGGKFYQKYGYFEARLKLPVGRGCWPAWWLYNSDTDARPEIDIMEAYPGGGVDGWWGTSNLHPTNYGGTVWSPTVTMEGLRKLSDALPGYTPDSGPDLSAGFYTYGALWDTTGVEFFWNGMSIGKVQSTDNNYRMFLFLDLWYGNASGTPNDAETPKGVTNAYSIDYVRCWALSDGSSEVSGSGPRYVPNSGGVSTPSPSGGTTPSPVVSTPVVTGSGGFTITSVYAPSDGTTLTGTINIEVDGTGIVNVELVPSGAYSPRYGSFIVNPNGTFATLALDTSQYADGQYTLRILAWNVSAGSTGGTELTAMTARTWTFANGNVSTTPIGSSGGTSVRPYGQDVNVGDLVFQDEFDGSSVDTNKWNTSMWYNSDAGGYRVQNSCLYMWAIQPPPNIDTNGNSECVSLTTDGKYYQQFGYFECRAKLPTGAAKWPAFWLYNHDRGDRPEIDIMEAYSGASSASWWADGNGHPLSYGGTLHGSWGDSDVRKLRDISKYSNGVRLDLDFHIYGCRWDPSGVEFFFDGDSIGTKWSDNTGYFHIRMYVLLDLWLGGLGGGNGDMYSAGSDPNNAYVVDYVRVWAIK